MRRLNWQDNPELLAFINVLAAASLLGFFYCLAALLNNFTNFSGISLTIYAAWFVLSLGSLYLMKRDDSWGAYMLILATIFVGLYELAKGTANFGGAMLAFSLILLLAYYLFIVRQNKVDEKERISDTL